MFKLLAFLKKYLRFFCLIGLLIILFICLFGNHEFEQDDKDIKLKDQVVDENISDSSVKKEIVEERDLVYVDIKGEVKNPGIYSVSSDKRVFDVIKLAGGVTSNADTSVNNLSMKVKDEMVIVIYSKEQIANFSKTQEINEVVQEKCNNSSGVVNDSCISTPDVNRFPISLNNASLEELINVPGLGEVKAKKIIEYRSQNNGFKSVDDLKNVSGIGDSTFEKIKDYFKL